MALRDNKAFRVTSRIFRTLSKYVGKIVTYILNVFLTLLLIAVISGSIMAAAMVVYVTTYIDGDFDIENLKFESNLSTSLYYADGVDETGNANWVELEDDRLSGSENRIWVDYDHIPKDLINAFVSIEDKRFFDHNGIDLRRFGGAVLSFATGNDSYGASTITQQLIKNVTNDKDVTLQRKITEIFRAMSLESKKSKEEILEMYLNTIYLSHGCYGVQSAAYRYFGKDVSQLSLVECAALAGITQYPSKWDPILNPDLNKERRHAVLVEMHNNGYINYDQYHEANEAELVIADETVEYVEKIHNYYINQVMNDVTSDLEKNLGMTHEMATRMLFSGGLKIYTAMNKAVQDELEKVFEDEEFFALASGVQPQAAMTVIDNETGNVAGLVGGIGKQTVSRGLNRAVDSYRQPGSAIKPLSVYSIALDNGYIYYGSSLDDVPYQYNKSMGRMWPRNTPAGYEGHVTLEYAIYKSKNTTAVLLLDKLTPQLSYRFLTDKFGITSLVQQDINLSSLALGGLTKGVSTYQMAAAYATFPGNGIYKAPRTYLYVEDSSGEIILNNLPKTKVIVSADTANTMNMLLQSVVDDGTGKSLTFTSEIDHAGKTGTTNDEKDLYFVGYTPYFTSAVWVGYDMPKSMSSYISKFRSKTGQTPALYLWDTVNKAIHTQYLTDSKESGVPLKSFQGQKSLILAEYCRDSGMLATDACRNAINGDRTVKGYFTEASLPRGTCDKHVTVKWCTDTRSIAGPGCTNTKQVSFLKINMSDRYFTKSVKVSDAQYTWIDLPSDYVYPSSPYDPIYINLYPENRYPGYTSSGSRPANSFCSEHNPTLTDAYLPWKRPTV